MRYFDNFMISNLHNQPSGRRLGPYYPNWNEGSMHRSKLFKLLIALALTMPVNSGGSDDDSSSSDSSSAWTLPKVLRKAAQAKLLKKQKKRQM